MGLNERDIELVIARRAEVLSDASFDFEALYDDSFVVVAGAKNPWVRRRRIGLAELVSEPWVLPPPESVIGSVAVETFRASGLDYPRVTVVTVPREVRMSSGGDRALSHNPSEVCIAIFVGTPGGQGLACRAAVLPRADRHHHRKNRTLSPVAKLFIDAAREVAKPLANKGRRNHGA